MSMSAFVAALGSVAAHVPEFVERPCADDRIAKIAKCGTVAVAENRQAPGGRIISLNVIVLPATSRAPHSPPVFDIDGGPGLPVTKHAEFYVAFGSAYRARRDIVMVDQRGTGASNPLHCPELSKPEATYQPLYPAEAVARCRESLEAEADLKRYGTQDAVADLDDVRAALGYDKIDLFGLSYGTTVALRYLDTYPQRVRAAVLMGVSPPDSMPPRRHAIAAAEAMTELFAECESDAACSAAFDPIGDLRRVGARIRTIAGVPSEEVFFEKLRSLMYQPSSARRIPYILDRAAQGDLTQFHESTRPRGPSLYADGMFLSVICSESMALMDYPAAVRSAQATMFGDYRLRRQKEACAEWPAGQVAQTHLRPVTSDAAILLISGELDPVTPPEWADEVARTLPNSKHVVIPGSGHIFDGMSGIETCLDPLIVSFLDKADVNAIDAGCIRDMRPPPFVISETKVSGLGQRLPRFAPALEELRLSALEQ